MCGIAGVHLAEGKIDEAELVRVRDTLTHRGPDDAGIWIGAEGRLGLVHRRLSIIDLSAAGHQPMVNEDGSVVLVFNGEIYNFQELRQTLEETGHVFRSQSDTEVIVHAYEEWGTKAIAKLNGMFALAIYDRQRQHLLLSRDRFGEKPLFYYHHRGCFLFASELKAIAAHSFFSPAIEHQLLFPYLIFGYIPYPRTIFAHTGKLPPAHSLLLDLGSQSYTIEPYWDPLPAVSTDLRGCDSLNGAVDGLVPILRDAVKLRLIADVPVGAFLSGGVDSSLVVSMAVEQKANLKTFAIGFGDDHHNEAPHARAVARHLGCQHHEYYVTPEEALAVLTQLPGIYDEPFADSSAVPTYLVSRFAREQVKVVLSGDGGDELFGGYTTYPHLAHASHLLRIPRGLRTAVANLLGALGAGKAGRHAALLLQQELWEVFLYLNERTVTKRPDAERVLLASQEELLTASIFAKTYQDAAARGYIQAALLTDAKTYLVDDNLVKVDRASMAVSLEARIPLLDVRVAEYALGLSERAKMGPRRQDRKRVLRALLGRYVPPALFERPKQGFSVPLARWFRGELRWLLDEYLGRERLIREGIFDAGVVSGLVQEHLSGRRDREAVLWALVFWEMWRERWRL